VHQSALAPDLVGRVVAIVASLGADAAEMDLDNVDKVVQGGNVVLEVVVVVGIEMGEVEVEGYVVIVD
jgi:hypothetical protein